MLKFYIMNSHGFFAIDDYFSYLDFVVYAMLTLIPLLLVVALFTLAESKVMASVQRSKGPNVVGIWGFLQPIADGFKLIMKEMMLPSRANKFLFILGPATTLFLSFIGWVAIPFDLSTQLLSLNNSILFVFVLSSLGVYGILLSGWASNSKYGLLGSLSSVAQMISYEVSMSLCILPIVLFSGSLNMNYVLYTQSKSTWFMFPMLPLAIIFFISILAETNSAPFDLAEAEAELVAGYNVEYSAFTFAAFFLGEYANMLFMCSIFVCFFLGGGAVGHGVYITLSNTSLIFLEEISFGFKIIILVFFFIFVRANLPSFSFDQLMFIGWKIFLPMTLGFVFFFSGVLYFFDSLNVVQAPNVTNEYNYLTAFAMSY